MHSHLLRGVLQFLIDVLRFEHVDCEADIGVGVAIVPIDTAKLGVAVDADSLGLRLLVVVVCFGRI